MVHYQRFVGFMLAVVSALLGACGGESPPVNGYDPEALRGYCGDDYGRIEQRIDELMAELNLVQKVEQMHGQGLFVINGVYTTVTNERLGIPGFAMVDGPRGVSRSTGTATAFPVSMARGATWDPELEARVGAMIAQEARGRGANVLLAPTINILRHPRWGRAQETYGEDPVHVGAMGSAFIQGAQHHVIATVKHFAVNSIENTRFEVDVTVDPRTLREVYLPHFERAISEAGAGAVMAAYNQVNGAYAAENPQLLRDILKGEWAFQGLVMSDWVFGVHSTVASALAGLDVEMPAAQFYGQPLRTAVQDGQLDEEVVDEAVRRILRAKLCFGLDTNPPVADPAMVDTAEAQTLALEVAQRGIVLLDNKGALPIDRAAVTSIVVAGPLADVMNLGDTGSSDVMPPYAITALAGITEAAGPVAVAHVPGDIADPVNEGLIRDADAVVVVVGLTAAEEGESVIGAGDRAELGLPAEQIALIHAIAALSERVIVVVEGGSAITMSDWLGEVEAVLMAWYPGMEGGHAIADILFGDIEPSGRLPVSIPRQEADLPVFDNVATTVSYDYDHGYRHLDRSGVEPLFPFGFGLAYTRFEYASMTVSAPVMAPDGQVTITVDITNVGDRAGIETVQLYVSAPTSRVQRPTRVLAAFAQVALDPAQTRTVELVVHARDLGFYDMESETWVVEAIPYELALGSSARTLPLGATVTVQ